MTVEDRLARLEEMLGVNFLGLSSDEIKAQLVPANELPGGRYPYILSDYQLHAAADKFDERLSTIEQRPSDIGDVSTGVVKDLTVTGNLTVKGRTALGGSLDPKCAAALELHGGPLIGDATIQWYSANGAKKTVESLSGDGGKRDIQNAYMSVDQAEKYDPDGNVRYMSNLQSFADPAKPMSQIGPDSKGNFSILRIEKPTDSTDVSGAAAKHEYTQDVVLEIDEAGKEIRWASYRRGWKWGFTVDAKYGPQTYWNPDIYVSRG